VKLYDIYGEENDENAFDEEKECINEISIYYGEEDEDQW